MAGLIVSGLGLCGRVCGDLRGVWILVWVSGLSFWAAVMVGWWGIVCTFDVGGLWVFCGCLW